MDDFKEESADIDDLDMEHLQKEVAELVQLANEIQSITDVCYEEVMGHYTRTTAMYDNLTNDLNDTMIAYMKARGRTEVVPTTNVTEASIVIDNKENVNGTTNNSVNLNDLDTESSTDSDTAEDNKPAPLADL